MFKIFQCFFLVFLAAGAANEAPENPPNDGMVEAEEDSHTSLAIKECVNAIKEAEKALQQSKVIFLSLLYVNFVLFVIRKYKYSLLVSHCLSGFISGRGTALLKCHFTGDKKIEKSERVSPD